MKHFNTKELNAGFQLDTSLLTPEQLEHVEAIFKARGVEKCNDWSENSLLNFDSDENSYAYYPEKIAGELYEKTKISNNLISYTTLCRGSVQLEPNTCMVAYLGTCNKIWELTKSLGLTVSTRRADIEEVLRWMSGYLESRVYTLENVKHCNKISPEEFEQRLRGTYPVVRENRTTQTPVTEQPRKLTAKENIQMLLSTVEEFSKTVYELEQENDQLENLLKVSKDLNQDYRQRIAELDAELGTRAKQRAETKEPVYDGKWLDSVVSEYANKKYGLFGDNHIIAVANLGSWAELDPKTSATIIMAALAKHLNGDWEGEGNYEVIILDVDGKYEFETWADTFPRGAIKFKPNSAQKAISILTEHFPEVLKNYLG